MKAIDILENKLCLLDDIIDFEEIIDEYLVEYPEEVFCLDPIEFRKRNASDIINRFSSIYNFNIITPEDGCGILNLATEEDTLGRKYLHRFLTYKNETGGKGATSDGSAALFEQISANAVKNFLGESSHIIFVGEDRTPLTKERLKEITAELNENNGVDIDLPLQAKDDGVDFIVYKSIDERNIGNIIILGQACVGKNYSDKKNIMARWITDYINFAIRPPIALLSVVTYLEAPELRKLHSQFDYAIVFDRGRIMRYFDSSDDELNAEIKSFVDAITD